MKAKIQLWGNSLALRIPKSFAIELGLQANSPVNLTLVKGTLVIEQIPEQEYNLEELLSEVRETNIPDPVDFGRAKGKEIW
ncbi:MAG: AbrB/MazE/SpoVT family DNA-binding domain-containing protein [Bacillota bacterium]|jgi:antitoxin MazE